VTLRVDFRFLLIKWVLGTELLAKGSPRWSRSVAFWMPSSRDLCLCGEGLDATESGVAAAMKFTTSNLGMVWWRTSEGMSR
jgi:hypothetical protein